MVMLRLLGMPFRVLLALCDKGGSLLIAYMDWCSKFSPPHGKKTWIDNLAKYPFWRTVIMILIFPFVIVYGFAPITVPAALLSWGYSWINPHTSFIQGFIGFTLSLGFGGGLVGHIRKDRLDKNAMQDDLLEVVTHLIGYLFAYFFFCGMLLLDLWHKFY